MARFSRLLTGVTGFLTFLLIPGFAPGVAPGAVDYQDLHLVRAGTNQ